MPIAASLVSFISTHSDNVLSSIELEVIHSTQNRIHKRTMILLSGVKQACSEFLEKQLGPFELSGNQNLCRKPRCESLQKAAEMYTYKFFEEVIHNEEFRTLSVKDVEKLIHSDEIQVSIVFKLLWLFCVHFQTNELVLLKDNRRIPPDFNRQ